MNFTISFLIQKKPSLCYEYTSHHFNTERILCHENTSHHINTFKTPTCAISTQAIILIQEIYKAPTCAISTHTIILIREIYTAPTLLLIHKLSFKYIYTAPALCYQYISYHFNTFIQHLPSAINTQAIILLQYIQKASTLCYQYPSYHFTTVHLGSTYPVLKT